MSELIPVQNVIEKSQPSAGVTAKIRQQKLYPKSIQGIFQNIRKITVWSVICGYFFLPWLNWYGRQAILFDLPERKFYILGFTFWPQDFFLAALLAIMGAFGLLAITTLAGRLYCGYACPQTVWTRIFVWIEEFVEGQRNQRMKLDRQPWSTEKVAKKLYKHSLWLLVAFLTGFAFVGYFSPVRELTFDLFALELTFWQTAFIAFFTLATYLNAGWMRELICLHACPYARFQSVMFDKDTLLISYDTKRGENRGKRKKNVDRSNSELGDCVDCTLCVQVCPTGIDIRDGLQYQCIGCAACIDACDSIMDKMGYKKGLIRYSTEHALKGEGFNLLRPRLITASVVFIALGLFCLFLIYSRVPLDLDVIRDRNQLFRTNSEGLIENIYTLKLMNKSQRNQSYQILLDATPAISYVGPATVDVPAGEIHSVTVRLKADAGELEKAKETINFTVLNSNFNRQFVDQESRFFAPAWVGK